MCKWERNAENVDGRGSGMDDSCQVSGVLEA